MFKTSGEGGSANHMSTWRGQAYLEGVIAFMVLAAGAIDCYANRYSITSDTVSYADLADHYLAGQWSQTVNGHWSRLYPVFLSIAIRLFHPSPKSESAYFHLVSFAFYAFGLLAFRLLVSEIIAWARIEQIELGTHTWSPYQFVLIGYALFVYVMRMISLQYVTPDLGVAATTFLATALLMRIGRIERTWKSAAALGATLGFGYLIKAVMMIVAVMCILLLFVVVRRRRAETVVFVCLVFFAISAPTIIALSRQEGRLTFSESGRLTYMSHVDGASYVDLDPRGNVRGTPVHPTRKIYDHPDAYEFATPIVATYPPWFDPAYWYQGLSPTFDLAGQLHVLKITCTYFATALLLRKGPLLALMLLLLILQHRDKVRFRYRWLLWTLPSLAPMVALALLYAQDRYIGGFVLSACILLLGSIQLRTETLANRVFPVVTATFVVGILAFVTLQSIRAARSTAENTQYETAVVLNRDYHLASGDPIACIGYCFDMYWARLARLRIIAEVPDENTMDNAAKGPVRTSMTTPALEFWSENSGVRDRVLTALAKTGAKAVVAVRPPDDADLHGWTRIGQTNYSVRLF